MRIDRDEVRRIAALASLEFDEAGESRMAGEMSKILDYIDQLAEAGSGTIASTEPSTPARLRDDVVRTPLPPEEASRNAPAFALGHFVVPKVIGSE